LQSLDAPRRCFTCGGSTGESQAALAALLAEGAPNLVAAVIPRLTAEWQAEYDVFADEYGAKHDKVVARLTKDGTPCAPAS
jgi:hypothetical protein